MNTEINCRKRYNRRNVEHMKKRVVTLLAAVSLVCSQFPMAVNAENTSDDGNIMQIFYVSPDGDDNASGTRESCERCSKR